MVETLFPGVYVQELPTRVRSIEGVSTSTAAFVGAGSRSVGPVLISSVAEFERAVTCHISRYLAAAVRGFFENGGRLCRVALSDAADPIEACLDALTTERLSMLCCPEEHDLARASEKMVRWCERRGDAICILQSPAPDFSDALPPEVRSSYAACYHPWLRLAGSADEEPLLVPPAGHVAGAYARADIERGVHHAPAPLRLRGVSGLSAAIAPPDAEQFVANGINVIRDIPGQGIVLWSARTTSENAEWKYVNVRRLALFLEQSLVRGLQWAVFEPNGAPLWEAITRSIEQFLWQTWKYGALAGTRPEAAFFVRCDSTTMTQQDIDSGRLVATVGIAPLRPAEFVLLRFTVQTDRHGTRPPEERR